MLLAGHVQHAHETHVEFHAKCLLFTTHFKPTWTCKEIFLRPPVLNSIQIRSAVP